MQEVSPLHKYFIKHQSLCKPVCYHLLCGDPLEFDLPVGLGLTQPTILNINISKPG